MTPSRGAVAMAMALTIHRGRVDRSAGEVSTLECSKEGIVKCVPGYPRRSWRGSGLEDWLERAESKGLRLGSGEITSDLIRSEMSHPCVRLKPRCCRGGT